MLTLDAAEEAPRYLLTLTTVDPETTPEMFTLAGSYVWKALRRRYGRVEYYGRLEDTTGKAARSGGYRRLHSHNCVKCDVLDVAEATELVRRAWAGALSSSGAEGRAWRVEFAPIRSAASLLHYVNQHYAKTDQHVRPELRVRTERCSRGYFVRPVAELREEAKAQLWAERLGWALRKAGGPGGITDEEARFLVGQQR